VAESTRTDQSATLERIGTGNLPDSDHNLGYDARVSHTASSRRIGMRWEFIGPKNAPLGEALQALAEARGWDDDEVEPLLAGLVDSSAPPETLSGQGKSGVPRTGRGSSGPASAALFAALRHHPSYRAARDRIFEALDERQRIILFGDYDADGITAVAQVYRFLVAAGCPARDLAWFVPNRMDHGYGLMMEGVADCLAACRAEWAREPGAPHGDFTGPADAPEPAGTGGPAEPRILLLALDCGSASFEVIEELKRQGIDCIVVDHHQPRDLAGAAHPAVAHLNPHAWSDDGPCVAQLRMLSASGLAFCLCVELARDRQVTSWDRQAGLVLAGLGTVADVVPLRGPNRRLVRKALEHANEAGFLERRLPGLARLHELSGGGVVDARTLGYRWGPRLNASGRIEDARRSVELLLTTDPARIDALARACEKANDDRKRRTAEVLHHAQELAAQRARSDAPDGVLVLWDESWEPGIVGIVAGRLREQLRLPTILLGKHPDQHDWKGSGRSTGDYDLGAEVRRAVEAGLAREGGGHPQAAGLTVDGSSAVGPEGLRAWMNERRQPDARDLEPVYEVLAPVHAAEALGRAARDPRDPSALVKFWCDLYDRFEPFGAGNPRPGLLLEGAELVACQAKTTMKGAQGADGALTGSTPPAARVWALSGRFRWNGEDSLLADWTDPEAARAVWLEFGEGLQNNGREVRFDLVLEPHSSSSAGTRGGAARTWHDWRVVACARSRPA
jgi:single-stranded-DNA-specific exonuclease